MLCVLPPTFKPVLQQIRMCQVVPLCCRKKRVVLLLETKCSVHVARFTAPYGVAPYLPIRSQYSRNLQQPNLLQDRFERDRRGKTRNIASPVVLRQCFWNKLHVFDAQCFTISFRYAKWLACFNRRPSPTNFLRGGTSWHRLSSDLVVDLPTDLPSHKKLPTHPLTYLPTHPPTYLTTFHCTEWHCFHRIQRTHLFLVRFSNMLGMSLNCTGCGITWDKGKDFWGCLNCPNVNLCGSCNLCEYSKS